MKKILVITSSFSRNGLFGVNYGAALQGYALLKTLRDHGYDAYDINYLSANNYSPYQYSAAKRMALRLKYLLDFRRFQNIKLIRNKIVMSCNRKNLDILSEQFRKFICDHSMVYNEGKFYTLDELRELSSSVDAFITGSDVVWNPTLYNNKIDAGFYLDFTPGHTKRIAYAPSIGVNQLPEECIKDFQEKVPKLDAISVREKSGAAIIKKHTGIDAQVVLDPTFLLKAEDYDAISSKPSDLPEHYIAVYKFGKLQHTDEKIKEIQKRLKLPVVYIPALELENGNRTENVLYHAGPSEFLWVIKHADFVISDSFHCTVFCLQLHTPFLTFCRTIPQKGKDINSRMIDLLDFVGLNDRMIMPGEEINYEAMTPIDFEEIDSRIDKKRKESLAYLLGALESES